MLRKTQKTTENQKNSLKLKPSGCPNFTFTVACRRGQFAPPAAAGRPKHRKNFHWLFARSGKNLRYFPLTRSSQVFHQKIFLSLLHFIGIQLIPVEFWLRPHPEPYQPHSIHPIGGGTLPQEAQNSVPSLLSRPEKASIPQIEIWSTRNQWS